MNNESIPGLTLFSRGKVRDIYDLGDKLLLVATDRISAFDVVLPTLIPDKTSVVTSKPANGGQVKTGQWIEGAKSSLF